jgi:stringent starvation protein A
MAEAIENSTEKRQATRARKALTESILGSAEVFAVKPYFLSDDFSLVDCSIAPILWRLRSYGIELSSDAKPIQQYMNRMFSRPSFQESLTELEHELQQ